MSRVSKSLITAATAGALLGTASCGPFLNPTASHITPTSAAEDLHEGKIQTRFNIEEAVAYGQKLRKEYESNIDDQILLRNMTDLALVPIVGATAFYGVSRAHSDVLLGLSVGGTGTYVLGQRYANASDQMIYASGIVALGCVLGRFEGQQSAYASRQVLFDLVGGTVYDENGVPFFVPGLVRTAIDDLSALVQNLPQDLSADDKKILLEARALIATAENVRSVTGQTALDALDSSGNRLIEAVNGIKAQVTQSLVTNQIDAGRFKGAMEAAFLSSVVKVARTPDQPVDGTGAPAEGDAKAVMLTVNARNAILGQMATLRELVRQVREIAERAARPPSTAELSKCDLDLDGTGIPLSVSRPGPIPVPVADGGPKLTAPVEVGFSVSGGRPPYAANWAGVYSGTLRQPTISSAGALTASLPNALPKGTYELEIGDSSQRGTPLVVKIQVGTPPLTPGAGNGQDAGGNGVAGNGDGANVDPEELKARLIQAFLRSKGITKVDVDGDTNTAPEDLTVDGAIGDITRKAMHDYLTVSLGQDHDSNAKPEVLAAAMMKEIEAEAQAKLDPSGATKVDPGNFADMAKTLGLDLQLSGAD